MLLQRHGRTSAGWLAEQLEVSERTILRDMEALSIAGVPVYTERGPHGGCRLLDGFTTDASGLTFTEAQALFAWTSRESVADLGLGPELTGALAKVAASASTGAVQRAESLGAVLLSDRRRWFAAAEQVPLLPLVREAAESRRRVRLTYRGAGTPRPGIRTVDPVGIGRPVRRLAPRRFCTVGASGRSGSRGWSRQPCSTSQLNCPSRRSWPRSGHGCGRTSRGSGRVRSRGVPRR